MKLNPKHLVPRKARDVVRKQIKHRLYKSSFPALYAELAQRPVDSRKVVFVDTSSPTLSVSMQRMYSLLKERGFACEYISLRMNEGFSTYVQQSKQMVKAVCDARLVVICEACPFVACLPLRDETTVVQLWHGCGAFKRFGMSTANKIFGEDQKEKLRYPEYPKPSLVTVSSPEVRWAYVEAMNMEDCPECVQALGVSRTDAYFDEGHVEGMRKRALSCIDEIGERKVVLYAPTFRGETYDAVAPDGPNIALMRKRLGREFVLLVKQHPHVKRRPAIPEGCEDFAFDVSDRLSIEECLCVADVCITDYSSIVFEYALFGRPMVFFAPDRDDYDDWRGFYYDYEDMTPGPIFATTEELVDYVLHVDERFDGAEVAAFRDKFMASCDGHATERILDVALGAGSVPEGALGRAGAESAGASGEQAGASGEQAIERAYRMSVIVPMYNSRDYLKRSVDSLDAQTAGQDAFEVVLVDDGSTDGTLALAQSLAANRPNYQVVSQENQGVSVARNTGMRAARGEYLMFLDADDTLSVASIEALVRSFDGFGDAVDLVTYPITYYDVQTGDRHGNPRSRWLTHSGVYDLEECPFVTQTTINVCVRNVGEDTPQFEPGRAHYEDQMFITGVLSKKRRLGFCAEAEYVYWREPTSVTMAPDLLARSFDDVVSAFECFEGMGGSDARFARYAYGILLYNLAWRLRDHKLLPDFGDEDTRRRNYERLGAVLRRVPLWAWEESPYLNDAQRLWLMQCFGVVGRVQGATCSDEGTAVTFDDGRMVRFGPPSLRVYWAVRTAGGLRLRGCAYGPALCGAKGLELRFAWNGGGQTVRARHVCSAFEDKGAHLDEAWYFEVDLPGMDRPYEVRVQGVAGDVAIPAFAPTDFDLCRTNSRRINARMREFGDRRLVAQERSLRVGTIKDLPTWSMPVVTQLMRRRDKTRVGDFDPREVRMLREELPRTLKVFAGERVWLYVHAGDVLERDMRMLDGVVRLDMDELEGLGARMAAFLGAERVVSSELELEDLLPCDWRTWDRVADLAGVREQTFQYAGPAEVELAGTPYD